MYDFTTTIAHSHFIHARRTKRCKCMNKKNVSSVVVHVCSVYHNVQDAHIEMCKKLHISKYVFIVPPLYTVHAYSTRRTKSSELSMCRITMCALNRAESTYMSVLSAIRERPGYGPESNVGLTYLHVE